MQFNTFPGNNGAYGLRRNEGPRQLVGGMVASQYARSEDTNNTFSLTLLTGAEGAGLPLMRHGQSHVGLYVMDGAIELVLGEKSFRLEKGDYASIPEGTNYGLRMDRVRNVVLVLQTGGESGALYSALGETHAGFVQPETGAGGVESILERGVIAGCDTEILDCFPRYFSVTTETTRTIPPGKVAYALRAGEGERLVVADQLFAFLGKNEQSGGRFFTLLTEGPKGDMVPPHFHEHHTECFFCLEGKMTMIVGQETIEIGPGDFLHVTPGTVHGYQLSANYTQFIGFLVPGIFEKFFGILGDAYEPKIYPQEPRPFRFDRVIARLDELDLVLMGKPRE